TKDGKPTIVPYGLAKEITNPSNGQTMRLMRHDKLATPKGWKSRLVPGDEQEVAAIQFLFKTFAAQDVSYRELAAMAKSQGYPEPTNKGWRGDSIQWMLSNCAYIGSLRLGTQAKGKFFRFDGDRERAAREVRAKASPLIVPNCHEPIIARELWEKV